MQTQHNFDLVIIGAGILGCSLALHARKCGLSVAVIERDRSAGSNASGKSAGQLRQLYFNPMLTEWALRSRLSWSRYIGGRQLLQNGSFILGRELPDHHRELFIAERLPRPLRLKTDSEFGVRTPTDGVITSAHVTKTVAIVAVEYGAQFYFNRPVESILHSKGQSSVVVTPGITFKAEQIALCGGAWADSFTSLPLVPYARHLVDIDGWPTNFMPVENVGYFWDETKSWYMKQLTQTLRVVSICDQEPANPDTYTERPEIGAQALALMRSLFPAQGNALFVKSSRCCFRTYATDRLPIWGFDTQHHNVFHLSGFGGFGMSTGFAAAEDAAMLLAGKARYIYPDFGPARFAATSSGSTLKFANE